MTNIPYNALRRVSGRRGLTRADKRQVRNMDAIPYGDITRSFADDFSTSSPLPFWNFGTGGASQSGGVAHTTPVDGHYDANYVAGPIDMRGKAIVIEAIPDGVRGVDRYITISDAITNDGGVGGWVNTGSVDQIDHDSTSTAQGGGPSGDPDSMFFFTTAPSFTLLGSSPPYDPVAHRWWRLRVNADGSASYMDTSPDGSNWTNQAISTSSWDRSRAYVSIGAGQYASPAIPTDTDVRWANFSIYG